jgi:hypothetical protein
MLRKQINIKKHQQTILRRLAKQRGVSEAEVIRQAIEREALSSATQSIVHDHAAIEEFVRFGLSRKVAADTTSRAWTRGELYNDRFSRYGRSQLE